ncbi:MAG: tyrosine-type recombinase/integrase [Actinomycetota bacterium]
MNKTINLDESLKEYKEIFLSYRNFAPRTRKEYINDISDLIKFLKKNYKIKNVYNVEKDHLQHYFAYLDKKGLKGVTRRRKAYSIKSFFRYLKSKRYIPTDISLSLIPPKRSDKKPRVLTEQEYKRLQLAYSHETRDAAIIELLLQTGMRLSELVNLKVDDIELPKKITKDPFNVGSIHIIGKGGKERTITLNWKACKAIKAYLKVRPKTIDKGLFITKFGKPMGPRGFQNVVKKYLEEANIRNASVHTLRHTFATHQVKKGTNIRVVQEALGHESLQTTSVYISLARKLMDKELQEHAL